MNAFTPSVQVPLFSHGLGAHSSMLVVQVVPLKPAAHAQVNPFVPSVHVPPFAHGFGAQSSTLVAHVAPLKPVAHAQTNEFTPSVQVPPLRHGLAAQSSTSVAHVAPLKPAGHTQVNAFTPSVQVPPFAHGLGVQSSTLVAHFAPVKPAAQVHAPSAQVPPLRHGFGEHSSTTSTVQPLEQPSPLVVLPSSHASGAVTVPSPHAGSGLQPAALNDTARQTTHRDREDEFTARTLPRAGSGNLTTDVSGGMSRSHNSRHRALRSNAEQWERRHANKIDRAWTRAHLRPLGVSKFDELLNDVVADYLEAHGALEQAMRIRNCAEPHFPTRRNCWRMC